MSRFVNVAYWCCIASGVAFVVLMAIGAICWPDASVPSPRWFLRAILLSGIAMGASLLTLGFAVIRGIR